MTIKYMDVHNLSDSELLSMSLREPSDSQVVKDLLSRIASIEQLLNLTIEELQAIEGMKVKPAEQLVAALELSKRIYSAPPRKNEIVNSPQTVADYLMPQLRYRDREVFLCLYLNHKNHFLFSETISVGGLSSSPVHPREIYKPALKRSAAKVILSHNHPSGDPTPSQEDIAVTQRIVDAGNLLGIPVLDHVIVGDGRWVSLCQLGYISQGVGVCHTNR